MTSTEQTTITHLDAYCKAVHHACEAEDLHNGDWVGRANLIAQHTALAQAWAQIAQAGTAIRASDRT
ncbi:hypothetical protein [Streptomyces sp. NPDC047097]|uniref:hypothetical protein n=1 Tax=Streptomyces sp. NPDC047097 TaxID=3155260 RepID=UPI0033F0AD0C